MGTNEFRWPNKTPQTFLSQMQDPFPPSTMIDDASSSKPVNIAQLGQEA